MTTTLPQTEANKIQAEAGIHHQFTDLLQRYPDYDFTPLLDLITCNTVHGYEAFFNQLAELISWHLQDNKWDNKYLMQVMHELFRDAFRSMRSGAAWKEA